MLKKIMTAALAASALAFTAPVAQADHTVSDCNFNSVQQETATGQSFEGVAWGYATNTTGGPISIRCYITVNGVEASSTPTGSGTGSAFTQGRVTFSAGDTDAVVLWSEVTTPEHGTVRTPYETTTTQFPPQEVIDLLDSVFDTVADVTKPADAVICLALRTAGAPGVINAATSVTGIYMDADDCDLWDGTGRIIDFDPYED